MLNFLLLTLGIWLIIQLIVGGRQIKKQQAEIMQQMLDKQERYKHLDESIFNELLDDELKEAVIMHIFSKEDEDYEHLLEHLTAGERTVYSIYQMEINVDSGRGNVYQFYTSSSKAYLPYLEESFRNVGCEKLAMLMNRVTNLVIAEQNGTLDIDTEDEDAPTFQSYTFDFLDLVEEEQLNDKIAKYIRSHQEEFIN